MRSKALSSFRSLPEYTEIARRRLADAAGGPASN
jgi:hypothetical protein